MANFSIGDILTKKTYERPMKSYMWRVELPHLQSNLNKEGIVWDATAAYPVHEIYTRDPSVHLNVSTRVSNISIPFSSVDSEKGIQGNTFWYYAKSNDIGQISMDIYEYEDSLTHSYIDAWQKLMFNDNNTYNPPVIYKHDLKFFRMSSNKTDLIVHTYKDYFITAVNDVSNDYDANEIVKWNITLTGDAVKHQVFDVSGKDPSVLDQLKKILSVESILSTVGSVVGGQLKNETGFNLPSY